MEEIGGKGQIGPEEEEERKFRLAQVPSSGMRLMLRNRFFLFLSLSLSFSLCIRAAAKRESGSRSLV